MNLNSIVQQLQAEQQHLSSARAGAGAGLKSADSSGGTSDSNSTTDEATITADDFLQLLVSELQNQDPTADTDPNEYVNQLVDVNSLQQLISINQEVGDLGPSSTDSGTGSSSSAVAALAAGDPGASPAAFSAQTANARASYAALQPQAESPGPSTANHASAPATASEVFDGLPSTPMNSAIPANWRPKSIAVH